MLGALFLVELVDERPKTGVSITAFGVAAVLDTTNTRPVIASSSHDDRSSVDGAWKGQLTFLKRPSSHVGAAGNMTRSRISR
jgi:hypothetical protein